MYELEPILFLAPVLWIALVLAASIYYRKKKGTTFPNFENDQYAFLERKASGSSNKNLITRIGGARNCLNIAVLDKVLYVFPMFPFNLMFLPEIYDLEHEIPLDQIQSASQKKGLSDISIELISHSKGRIHTLNLRLEKPEEFLNVLQNEGI